jgi:hypothetical protein
VLDGAVLAGGIHRLDYQKQCPGTLRVQLLLLSAERLEPAREPGGRLVFRIEAGGVVRPDLFQAEAASIRDPEA